MPWLLRSTLREIVTGCGLDGPGIESCGGEIFRICPGRPWGPPNLLYNGYRVFPGGKERPGRDADPSPPSSAVAKKEKSSTSTPPMGRKACTEPQCLYKGALYLYLYFKSPSLLGLVALVLFTCGCTQPVVLTECWISVTQYVVCFVCVTWQ